MSVFSDWVTFLVVGVVIFNLYTGQTQACTPTSDLIPYPESCFKFFICDNSVYVLKDCPDGLVFNNRIKRCDFKYYVPECKDAVYINPCSSRPCAQGTCLRSPNYAGGYECSCYPGFHGFKCDIDINECEVPRCLHGVCHNSIGGFYCDCGNSGYSGPYCEIEPNGQPCVQGQACVSGRCYPGPNSNVCVCDPGYTGRLCEETLQNPCLSRPCQNGGLCSNLGSDRYTCNCASTGFYGQNCEYNVNECTSQPCLNRGRCIDGVNSYRCDCAGTQYTGSNCEVRNYCDPFPCNVGTCTNEDGGFRCNCTGTNYQGVFCDSLKSVSESCIQRNPCIRGQCVDTGNGLTCDCTSTGFSGPICNVSGSGVTRGEGSNTCDCSGTDCQGPLCPFTVCSIPGYNPCENGGTCSPQGVNDYRCQCPLGFGGSACEIVIPSEDCVNYQCPSDVPRYHYPDWSNANCETYYRCEYGVLDLQNCPLGQKFDVITMTCKSPTDQVAVFCNAFRQ